MLGGVDGDWLGDGDVGVGVGDGDGFVLTKMATCDPVFWNVPPVGDCPSTVPCGFFLS